MPEENTHTHTHTHTHARTHAHTRVVCTRPDVTRRDVKIQELILLPPLFAPGEKPKANQKHNTNDRPHCISIFIFLLYCCREKLASHCRRVCVPIFPFHSLSLFMPFLLSSSSCFFRTGSIDVVFLFTSFGFIQRRYSNVVMHSLRSFI